MSKRCEEMGPSLAAWIYDEADADEIAAVEAHLEECEPCRLRHAAFAAVRGNLQEWEPASPPRSMTFIGAPPAAAPEPAPRPSAWASWGLRGAAVAASFAMGLMLTAAAVNLEIRGDDGGWVVRTSLFDRPAVAGDVVAGTEAAAPVAQDPEAGQPRLDPAGPGDAQPRQVGIEDIERDSLESWLDDALNNRGLLGDEPRVQTVADTLTESERRQVVTLIADSLESRQQAERAFWADMIAASESRQREAFLMALSSLYDSLESERQTQIIDLASQVGLIEYTHGEELARTNDKIDYLLTLVATPEAPRQENR